MTQLVRIELDGKQTRTVNRCLQEIFSRRSLEPFTLDTLKAHGFLEYLRRRVKIEADGREARMSSTCATAYDRVVDVLALATAEVDLFTREDIGNAMRDVYEACWRDRQVPEDAAELVGLICVHVEERIANRTIVAALRGVALDGMREIPLGKLRLVASAEELLQEANLLTAAAPPKGASKRLFEMPCLYGCKLGTPDAVKQWYQEQAYLVAGMLAVEAGATYERAASTFFIEPEFQYRAGFGSVYFFWDDKSKHLGRSHSFARGHVLKLSRDRVTELTTPGAFSHAFEIFQNQDRSDLENAITRAVFWYGDAHRDSPGVMQFIKYWSCLEGLLGGPGENLTETLALGVVSVLTFGHFRLLNETEWGKSVKTVKRLYALRSRAVHRGAHSHITTSDLVLLGTWVAWVIYNAISFSHSGMRETSTLWQRVQSVSKGRTTSV